MTPRADPTAPKTLAVPVVCAIIKKGNKVLACRRSGNQTNAYLWEFPGGKIRKGESPRSALIREIREELDVDVIPHAQLSSVKHTYPWTTIELFPFVCTLAKGKPHPLEHTEIRWADRNEVVDLDWTPADSVVIRHYLA